MMKLSSKYTTTSKRSSKMFLLTVFLFFVTILITIVHCQEEDKQRSVSVDIISSNEYGDPVTTDFKYRSHVTLYIEDVVNGEKTPSGWSTRVEDGAHSNQPFEFQPGVNLIPGWTQGVLQMKEGERAWLHVPSHLGYGPRPMGRPGGAFYIPANSDLLFDIQILGKVKDAAEL